MNANHLTDVWRQMLNKLLNLMHVFIMPVLEQGGLLSGVLGPIRGEYESGYTEIGQGSERVETGLDPGLELMIDVSTDPNEQVSCDVTQCGGEG